MDQIVWTKQQDRELAEFYKSSPSTDLRALKKSMNNIFSVPALRKRLGHLNLIQQSAPPVNMTPGRHAAVNAKRVSSIPFPKLTVKIAVAKDGNEKTVVREDSQSPRRSSRRMSVLGGANQTGKYFICNYLVVKNLKMAFEKPALATIEQIPVLPTVKNKLPVVEAPKSMKKKPVPIKEIIEGIIVPYF
jgi:hypothetical protein